jgi:hypothetical protein
MAIGEVPGLADCTDDCHRFVLATYRQAARLQQGTSAARDHAAEDADRCEHSGVGQSTGGGSHLQPRGDGD